MPPFTASPNGRVSPLLSLLSEDFVFSLDENHNLFGVEKSWALIAEEEEAKRLSQETFDERMKRINKENAARALETLEKESYEIKNSVEIKAIQLKKGLKRGEEVKKKLIPCKWLYCDESVPKSQWTKGTDGKLHCPEVEYITGSQCWYWEYTDPKDKKFKTPRICEHLHPNQPGWCKEWEKNRFFNPEATETQNRFAILKK
jgi:hypothetical protein